MFQIPRFLSLSIEHINALDELVNTWQEPLMLTHDFNHGLQNVQIELYIQHVPLNIGIFDDFLVTLNVNTLTKVVILSNSIPDHLIVIPRLHKI